MNSLIAGSTFSHRVFDGKGCQPHVGHEHNYDHQTLVIEGSIKIERTERDGSVTRHGPFGPLEGMKIEAGCRHTVYPLSKDTRYACIFLNRDHSGLVVDEYVGDVKGYQ
jgi:hypothetical protein